MNNRKYGWKPQEPDRRDYHLKYLPRIFPEVVDLRPQMPPVYDQGRLGSCTANGIGAYIQFLCMNQKDKWQFTPSRLFIYYNERALEGSIDTDAGANIRDGIKTVNVNGVCPETEADGTNPDWLWTYSDDNEKFRQLPPSQCYKDAILHRALQYQAIDLDRTSILTALSTGSPIVFGFLVHKSFESTKTAQTGVMQVPGLSFFDPILGGHCVLAVGYLLNHPMGDQGVTDWVIVRNSWSDKWGHEGYFYMPLDKVMCSNETSDAWLIQLIGAK